MAKNSVSGNFRSFEVSVILFYNRNFAAKIFSPMTLRNLSGNKLKKWKTISSKRVLDHPWCKVRQDEVELPNGKIIDDFFVSIKPEVSMILPITDKREVVFVRQYRHAVGDFFIELPAGNFDPDQETAESAAIRELQEETGYIAQAVKKIATLHDKPSKDTNQIHLFLAENVTQTGKQNFDITEDIEVILIPIESVLEKVTQGEISVAGTVAALFLGLKLITN